MKVRSQVAGTKIGAAKRRAAIIKKHGSLEAYKKIHRAKFRKTMIKKLGGKDKYLEEQRKRAAKGGRTGSLANPKNSINAAVDQPNSIRKSAYKNEGSTTS